MYREWGSDWPGEIEVRALQLPGRPPRMMEVPFRRLSALVGSLAREIAPLTDVPFAFFGHSLGALVAYTLACELRRERAPLPVKLFLSGCPAPALRRNWHLHRLVEPEFRLQLRALGGTPPELLEDPELMEVLSPIVRADFEVYETWEYREELPLDLSITGFWASDDPWAPEKDVRAWDGYSTQPCRFYGLTGGHFFLHREEIYIRRQILTELMESGGLDYLCSRSVYGEDTI